MDRKLALLSLRVPKPRASKVGKLRLRVFFLDDSERTFEVEQRILGGDFYNKVCGHLKLLEKEYFGLEFRHHTGSYVWLELLKPLAKQIRNTSDLFFKFIVKFFPPDPGQLQRGLTRYLFALQIKQDLSNGSLTCNDNSAALLVSHILQSELGNYEEELDARHLELKQYVPNQEYLDHKIMRFHKRHRGSSPADSDVQLLEVARKLDMYGIRPHAAHDGEDMRLNLAVTHSGLLVFQGNTKINTFSWAKVRKLSFKRKNFLIKLHDKIGPSRKDTVEFSMASRDVCKAFWRTCVENHAFFRLEEEPQAPHTTLLGGGGSGFRYSGRTQKQLFDCMSTGEKNPTLYDRNCCKSDYDSRQFRSSPDLLTDVAKQLYEQSHLFPHSDCALAHSEEEEEARPPVVGGAKRSRSAVEVVFSTELQRSRPQAHLDLSGGSPQLSSAPASAGGVGGGRRQEERGGHHRLAGHHGNRARRRPNPRPRSDAQQLVLLYPNNPAYQFHPVLPSFPPGAYGPHGHAYLSAGGGSVASLERFPQTRRRRDHLPWEGGETHPSLYAGGHDSSSLSPLRRNVRPPSSSGWDSLGGGLGLARVYQSGGWGGGGRRLDVGHGVEAGHYSDDSKFLPGLPRRTASQPDIEFPPAPRAPASEFRPLGYYPHLSHHHHHHAPTRPTYLPLNSSSSPLLLPDRPASLCVLAGGGSSYSDSDPEVFYPYYCPRPPPLGKVVRPVALARMRFSSGSLQLDEEDEGDEREEGEEEERRRDAPRKLTL